MGTLNIVYGTTNSFSIVLSLDKLVVGFPLHPVARGQTTEQQLSDLIVAENKERERNGRQPPVDLEGIHPQTLVHARSIGQEDCQEGLKQESKVHDPVLHALLEYREFASLANNQISPLYNNDGNKKGSVAGVFK